MHKNKKARMALSLLLSFFLAVAIFLTVSAIVLKTGFLPGNSWRNYLTGSGYGGQISQEAGQKIAELLETYGLPKEVAGELIWPKTLYVDYSRWLKDCWEGESEDFCRQEEYRRRDEFEEQLKSRITAYLTEYQVNITKPMEEEIQAAAEEAGRIFQRYLAPGWLLQMQDLQEKYQGIFTAAIIAGIMTAALCGLLLWKLHRYKHRALRFVIFAMEAAALWSGLSLMVLKQKDWIAQSGIAPAAYQNLIGKLTDIGVRNGLFALAAELWILMALAVWMKGLKRHAS